MSNGHVYVYDEETARYIECDIEEVHIPVSYFENPSSEHDYDYALVTVAEDLSEYGILKLGIISEEASESDNIPITVSGYPTEVKDENENVIDNPNQEQLYTGTGKLLDVWSNRLLFDTDQSEGNSGSPVYVRSYYTSGSDSPVALNTVVGITTGDIELVAGDDESVTNDAVRMTEPMLQFYLNNPNIGY